MTDIPTDIKVNAKAALDKFEREHGHEVIFANISGSYLFGTAGKNSDIDLRGCYIVPTNSLFKFSKPRDTVELSKGICEIQFHELEKFLSLMVKGNMNFIEEVLSPHRIVDTPIADEIRVLAEGSLSKATFGHVQGMSIHTKKHAQKENFSNPKRNLYLLRELLRGIVLFRDGIFKSDVNELADIHGNADIKELTNNLVELKGGGKDFNQTSDFRRLIGELETEMLRAKEFGTLRVKPSDDIKIQAEKLLNRMRIERVDTNVGKKK